jgi:hypothetical protein
VPRFTQLGYNRLYDKLAGSGAQRSSISRLAKAVPKCSKHLIFGKNALGTLITEAHRARREQPRCDERYEGVVPSKYYKVNDLDTRYLAAASDGFTVGSIGGENSDGPDEGGVAAIQLELTRDIRYKENKRNAYAHVLAKGITDFMKSNYGPNWKQTCCSEVSSGPRALKERLDQRDIDKSMRRRTTRRRFNRVRLTINKCRSTKQEEMEDIWRDQKNWMDKRDNNCR